MSNGDLLGLDTRVARTGGLPGGEHAWGAQRRQVARGVGGHGRARGIVGWGMHFVGKVGFWCMSAMTVKNGVELMMMSPPARTGGFTGIDLLVKEMEFGVSALCMAACLGLMYVTAERRGGQDVREGDSSRLMLHLVGKAGVALTGLGYVGLMMYTSWSEAPVDFASVLIAGTMIAGWFGLFAVPFAVCMQCCR